MALAKSQRSLKAWGKQKWRTKSGKKSSDQSSIICGVCGNDKSKTKRNKKGQTICEATERDCKKNS